MTAIRRRRRDAPQFPDGRDALPGRVIVVLDHCTDHGAARLARRVVSFWEARGFDTVRLQIALEGRVWVIRGNLIAGLPPSRAVPAIAAAPSPAPRERENAGDRRLNRAPAWLGRLTSCLARLA